MSKTIPVVSDETSADPSANQKDAAPKLNAPAAPGKGKQPPEVKKPAAAAPKKTREELLAELRADSDARVNYEEYMFSEEQGNMYDVPEHLIPEGFTVQWMNLQVAGKNVNGATLHRYEVGGWKPAPVELFTDLVAEGYEGAYIERDGMILMIRPKATTDKFRAIEKKKAEMPLQDKLREIGETPEGEMERIAPVHKRTIENVLPVEKD